MNLTLNPLHLIPLDSGIRSPPVDMDYCWTSCPEFLPLLLQNGALLLTMKFLTVGGGIQTHLGQSAVLSVISTMYLSINRDR